MKVSEALEKRRAIKNFDASHEMPAAEFKKMMDLVLKSPTSFNIQNWRFVHVTDQDKRAEIKAAAWNQAQITDASALIILCADVKSWAKDPARYWKNAPSASADVLVPMIGSFYEGREWIQRDEAFRSVGIAAQSLMLLSAEMGYESCPMIGFDQDAVAKTINLPEDHVIGMIVTIGKATSPAHARGGAIDYAEAVIENNF